MENSELITKALNYIKSETQKSEITIDDIASHAAFLLIILIGSSSPTRVSISWNMYVLSA